LARRVIKDIVQEKFEIGDRGDNEKGKIAIVHRTQARKRRIVGKERRAESNCLFKSDRLSDQRRWGGRT